MLLHDWILSSGSDIPPGQFTLPPGSFFLLVADLMPYGDQYGNPVNFEGVCDRSPMFDERS